MGFPGHFKITGHSGTEFKHRKAFSKIKSYKESGNHKKNKSDSGEFILPIKASVPTDYQHAYRQDRKMRLYFKLPVFLITLTLISLVLLKNCGKYESSVESRNHQALMDYTIEQKDANAESYIFFLNSGYYHLNRNELNTAQWEFTRALYIDEYGKEARIGLTRTLIAQCKEYQKECDNIQVNLDFLHNMKYLPIAEIEKMWQKVAFIELVESKNRSTTAW